MQQLEPSTLRWPEIDRDAALQHLAAVGYMPSETVVIAIYPQQLGMRCFHRVYEVGDIDWRELEQMVQERPTYSIGFVVNPGGTKISDIRECRAHFFEFDDLPDTEQQLQAWRDFDLPQPTLQVDTGNKSVHQYFRLVQGDDPTQWRKRQEQLLHDLLLRKSDNSLVKQNQVLRLAGTWHPKTRQMARIVSLTGEMFTPEQIEACLPAIQEPEKVVPLAPRPHDPDAAKDRYLSALEYVPGRGRAGEGGYQSAFRVLCALVKEFGPAEAEAIAERWSPSDPRNGWSVPAKIRSILEMGAIRSDGGTIVGIARENGWQDPWQRRIMQPLPDRPRQAPIAAEGAGEDLNDDEDDRRYRATQRILEPIDQTSTLAMYGELQSPDNRTLMSMLRSNYGERLRYNILEQAPQLDGATLDFALDHAYLRMADNGWKVSKDKACDAILAVAKENSFCPVVEYLEAIAASVSPMDITRLASRFIRPEDAELPEPTIYDRMMEVCVIGAVRRVYNPGSQHDSATILYSAKQGKRKTTFWETLAGPDFFCGDFKDHSKKDDLLKLHRGWITEWGELDHITGKRAVGEVKHFLTIKRDLLRLPYARDTVPYPRRGIIVGSTNKEDFMVDDTGNRRFHVIPVTAEKIDVEAVAELRDAIWAGAIAAYRQDRPNYLTKPEEDVVDQLNLGHLQQSDWQPAIMQWLAGPGSLDLTAGRLTVAAVLEQAIQKPRGQWSKADRDEVSRCLRQMGLEQRQVRIGGARLWVWL